MAEILAGSSPNQTREDRPKFLRAAPQEKSCSPGSSQRKKTGMSSKIMKIMMLIKKMSIRAEAGGDNNLDEGLKEVERAKRMSRE